MDTSANAPATRRSVWVPRIVITLGAVIAIGAFTLAFQGANTGPQGKQLDLAVESVFPTQNALEPRQTTVLIDLGPGWTVDEFWIEGIMLEDRFINSSGAALGQYFFEPSPESPFPVFRPGNIDVVVIIFNELDPTERRNISWSFTAA